MNTENEYKYKKLDENYKVQNFVLFYKKYFDKFLIQENEAKFNDLLNKVSAKVYNIQNVEKNMLFICNDNISKYVFLSAFSMLPKLVSNRCMSVMDLIDAWWGTAGYKNEAKEDDEVLNSEQDVREDILCLYMDEHMLINKFYPGVVNGTISSRTDRCGKRTSRQYTWIFYRGSLNNILKNEFLITTYNMYQSNSNLYQVVDLSSLDGIMGGVGGIGNASASASTLHDIY